MAEQVEPYIPVTAGTASNHIAWHPGEVIKSTSTDSIAGRKEKVRLRELQDAVQLFSW